MRRGSLGFLLAVHAVAAPAAAQNQRQNPFKGDILARQDWNDNFFTTPDPTPSQRRRIQLRTRMEIESSSLRMIVGADINYSSDTNLEPKDIALPLRLIRDNYDSRGIRLDLASLGINVSNIRLDAGRLAMPLRVTEMIWDRDLRVQGGTASWSFVSESSGREIVRLVGAYSRGGHVFRDSEDPDGSTTGNGATLKAGSLDIGFGGKVRGGITASYLRFDKLDFLEAKIRRQNTRVAAGIARSGNLAREFGVVDLIGRLRIETTVPIEVVFNYALNHKATDQRKGVWAAAVLGSLRDGRVRGEYTYSSIDRDATVAAYAGDDFIWGTGWDGHRVDLGVARSPNASFHVVGQLQRFKDSAVAAERDQWVRRLRLELRRVF
jgi:hypothetical protein